MQFLFYLKEKKATARWLNLIPSRILAFRALLYDINSSPLNVVYRKGLLLIVCLHLITLLLFVFLTILDRISVFVAHETGKKKRFCLD